MVELLIENVKLYRIMVRQRGGAPIRGRGGRGDGPPPQNMNQPEGYTGTLLTRNETHASNNAYDRVSHL